MRPVLLFVVSCALAVASPHPSPLPLTLPVRVMPLGDSLTDGYGTPGGYRIGFAEAARRANWPFTFVGSRENGPIELFSRRHEGHPGWRIQEIADKIGGWLAESRPDLILLLIGTNDILLNDDPAHAPARVAALLDRLSQHARVIVSTLPPLADPAAQARVQLFNAALPAVVDALVKRKRRVTLADLGPLISTADLSDGIHPLLRAHLRLGEAWFQAVVKAR